MMNSTYSTGFVPGLAGVVAAQTRLSSVNGLEGELNIAGFPLEEIANQATFEEVAYLLWNNTLPTPAELDKFRQALAAQRVLPTATIELLKAAGQYQLPTMDALLLAASTFSLDFAKSAPPHQAVAVLARFPVIGLLMRAC
jgi:citrate synthase